MALAFALVSGLLFAWAAASVFAIYSLFSQISNLIRQPEIRSEFKVFRVVEFFWYTVASCLFTALLYYVVVKREWDVFVQGSWTHDPFLMSLYANVLWSVVCAAVMTVFNFVTMVMGVWDTKSDAEKPLEENLEKGGE